MQDSSDEARLEDHRKHTPAPRRYLDNLVGASGNSPSVLSLQPATYLTLTEQDHSDHEDLFPVPDLNFDVLPSLSFEGTLLSGCGPKVYLSRE